MPISAERFATGMTFPEYVAQMRENHDRFVQTAEALRLRARGPGAPLRHRRAAQRARPHRGLVRRRAHLFARLARVTACAPHWNVRIFNRDANPDLADQYLNGGRWRSVPVVVFYDGAMRELGRFIERPAVANADRQRVIDAVAREEPVVRAGAPYQAQSDAAKLLLSDPLRELRAARKPAWQQAADRGTARRARRGPRLRRLRPAGAPRRTRCALRAAGAARRGSAPAPAHPGFMRAAPATPARPALAESRRGPIIRPCATPPPRAYAGAPAAPPRSRPGLVAAIPLARLPRRKKAHARRSRPAGRFPVRARPGARRDPARRAGTPRPSTWRWKRSASSPAPGRRWAASTK